MLIIETLDVAREDILAISYLRRDLGLVPICFSPALCHGKFS